MLYAALYLKFACALVSAETGLQKDDLALYVSTDGVDGANNCTEAEPCATFAYAVQVVAPDLQPMNATVTIALGAGRFDVSSCGVESDRPIRVIGAGKQDTVIDCNGTSAWLMVQSTLIVQELTIVDAAADFSDFGVIALVAFDTTDINIHISNVAFVHCRGDPGVVAVMPQGGATDVQFVFEGVDFVGEAGSSPGDAVDVDVSYGDVYNVAFVFQGCNVTGHDGADCGWVTSCAVVVALARVVAFVCSCGVRRVLLVVCKQVTLASLTACMPQVA